MRWRGYLNFASRIMDVFSLWSIKKCEKKPDDDDFTIQKNYVEDQTFLKRGKLTHKLKLNPLVKLISFNT